MQNETPRQTLIRSAEGDPLSNLMEAVQHLRIRIDVLEEAVERQARQIEGLEYEVSYLRHHE